MKKVAFIHASQALRNAVNESSLILEKVPYGFFSRVRTLDMMKTETVLEGVIRDVALIKEINDIVVVTSVDHRDDAIVNSVSALQCEKSLRCYRVGEDKEYSFSEAHKDSLSKEWPFVRFPVYGAWHIDGFIAIGREYAAELAFIVQADTALLLDTSAVDVFLTKYTNKGIWGTVQGHVQTDFAILNYDFVRDLARCYTAKAQASFKRKKNVSAFRLDSYLAFYSENEQRTDFTLSVEQENAPMRYLLDRETLEQTRAFASMDLQVIDRKLTEGTFMTTFMYPAFIEIELISSDHTMIARETFQRLVHYAGQGIFVVNCLVYHWDGMRLKDYLSYARKKVRFLMVEIDAACLHEISSDSFDAILESVDLIQLNTNADIDTQALMKCVEGVNKRPSQAKPMLVLRIAPQDIEKYNSFKQLVDKLLIKSDSASCGEIASIQFEPVDRFPCKKLVSSLFCNAHGKSGVCRFMAPVTHLSPEGVLQTFNASEIWTIRNKHFFGDYSFHDDCKGCHDWYIPDVSFVFPNMLFLLFVDVLIARIAELALAECLLFCSILKRIEDNLVNSLDAMSFVSMRFSVRIAEQYKRDMWNFIGKLKTLFLALGERQFVSGDIPGALDSWECVLKADPSNAHIQARLASVAGIAT